MLGLHPGPSDYPAAACDDMAARRATQARNRPMKTITITGYRRPHLFRDLLTSLAANDLTGWSIFIRLEPSPAVAEFIASANDILAGQDWRVTVNTEVLGVRRNPFALLEEVFAAGSTINIYLEEDMVVAPDTIALAEWFESHCQSNWICLSLLAGGCGGRGPISQSAFPDLLFLARTFNSLGFVATRAAWRTHFAPNWMADPPGARHVAGWDWSIHFHLVRHPHLRTVQPALARANHTGRDDGEHCSAEFHDLAFGELPVASLPAGSCAYRLLKLEELPAAPRRHAMLWDQVVVLWGFFLEKNVTIDSLFDLMRKNGADAQRARKQSEALREQLAAALERQACLEKDLDVLRARLHAQSGITLTTGDRSTRLAGQWRGAADQPGDRAAERNDGAVSPGRDIGMEGSA
jgi:hypothetical protein